MSAQAPSPILDTVSVGWTTSLFMVRLQSIYIADRDDNGLWESDEPDPLFTLDAQQNTFDIPLGEVDEGGSMSFPPNVIAVASFLNVAMYQSNNDFHCLQDPQGCHLLFWNDGQSLKPALEFTGVSSTVDLSETQRSTEFDRPGAKYALLFEAWKRVDD